MKYAIMLGFCKSGHIISLSTVVLTSRDSSEIVWLLENFLSFKNQLYPKKPLECTRINPLECTQKNLLECTRWLYPKKPAGMHWLGYNDAVSWLNKAKTRIFQPTANFENLKFTCISSASLPACLP